MSTNSETKNITVPKLPPIQIILAESDRLEIAKIKLRMSLEIAQIKLSKNDKIQIVINTVTSYAELLKSITREQPQLIFLGKIDLANYFVICRECHKIQENLPIVLLSNQEINNNSFREVLKSYGLTDIISSNDFARLNELLQSLDLYQKSSNSNSNESCQKTSNTSITGQEMLAAIEEIVIISNNYFGPLAQGNYWRKAHAHIVDEFPFIQNWSSDRFSKLSCNNSILGQELTDEEIHCLQMWVKIFIEECERIIVDFRLILNNSHLSPLAKNLLTLADS
jgi:hypothetical protein